MSADSNQLGPVGKQKTEQVMENQEESKDELKEESEEEVKVEEAGSLGSRVNMGTVRKFIGQRGPDHQALVRYEQSEQGVWDSIQIEQYSSRGLLAE